MGGWQGSCSVDDRFESRGTRSLDQIEKHCRYELQGVDSVAPTDIERLLGVPLPLDMNRAARCEVRPEEESRAMRELLREQHRSPWHRRSKLHQQIERHLHKRPPAQDDSLGLARGP